MKNAAWSNSRIYKKLGQKQAQKSILFLLQRFAPFASSSVTEILSPTVILYRFGIFDQSLFFYRCSNCGGHSLMSSFGKWLKAGR
ncbi:hypothetical protein ACJJIG_18415 [Microbulbifer sp. SSSA007]|uniref:hypothetical protein n=1 Tax=Microbulbifer sp. SSSA007 TaxID=3243379 RepID=UPI004039D865